VWLSGGIDSSVLLYLTAEIIGSEKVRAYTLKFGERDETASARRIAEWCDVKHIVREMTPKDSIDMTEEAVLRMRAPVDSTAVLYISRLCEHNGTRRVVSALGLDELMGGYAAHVVASDKRFAKVETELLWRCQSNYVWIQLLQSRNHVDLRFPYLDPELIAFCRGLPRFHKCRGQETKFRIREELNSKNLIPKENVEAGRIVGTKGGFIPVFSDWFRRGYSEWCDQNLPPKAFNRVQRIMLNQLLGRGRTVEGRLQRRLRASTLNTFYYLVDEGRFLTEDDGR